MKVRIRDIQDDDTRVAALEELDRQALAYVPIGKALEADLDIQEESFDWPSSKLGMKYWSGVYDETEEYLRSREPAQEGRRSAHYYGDTGTDRLRIKFEDIRPKSKQDYTILLLM